MKNKNKFWHRMAKKSFDGTVEIRNGRKIRDMMRNSNGKGGILPIHLFLFRSAGITTPIFDKVYADLYNINNGVAKESVDSNIEDAEIIKLDNETNEGVTDAVAIYNT